MLKNHAHALIDSRMIDTHTHLYLPEFITDENPTGGIEAVDRALNAGVTHMIFPNVDLTTIEPMHSLHAARKEVTSVAIGLHPTEVGASWRDDLDAVMAAMDPELSYVAIGEIGMDLYWDRTYEDAQMQALDTQLQIASKMNLPVIIHCREALPQTLEVLQAYPDARGVMHSFGGTPHDVDKVRKVVDFYFGINGIVTFKNSTLRQTLPAIGTNRLLLETDSPYLAPVPHRGRRNESAYITHTAAHIASSLSLPIEEIDRVTTQNARNLFGI